MWTVATTSVDGLRCIGDGHYNTIALEVFILFATAIFSREANSSTTFQTLESIPFVNEFVSNDSQPSEPILRQLSPPTHQNYQSQASHHRLQTPSISVPSTTPSPTNPVYYLSSMFTARYYSTDLLISRFYFSLFLLYKRTQNIPKAMSQYQ